MQHRRRVNRRQQLLIEDVERLTKPLTTSSTCEACNTTALGRTTLSDAWTPAFAG
jgi:hypothetical protein